MDTITATAAAVHAQVTVATVRAWCRYGAIAAVRAGGRWAIDAASLARRIQIGKGRRMAKLMPPIHLTSKTRRVIGHLGAVGAADALKAAFEDGRQVTLDGQYAGERVWLGHTRQTYGDSGITLETVGLDTELPDGHRAYPGVPCAVYLVDCDRLGDAPRLAELVAKVHAKRGRLAAEAERRAAREENTYLNPRYL